MSHDLGGFVLHRDHAVGMAERHARRKLGMAGQKRLKHGLVAMQDHIKPGILRHRISKTGNDSCRPAIATHGVN